MTLLTATVHSDQSTDLDQPTDNTDWDA